jgi:hypothetical protein
MQRQNMKSRKKWNPTDNHFAYAHGLFFHALLFFLCGCSGLHLFYLRFSQCLLCFFAQDIFLLYIKPIITRAERSFYGPDQ